MIRNRSRDKHIISSFSFILTKDDVFSTNQEVLGFWEYIQKIFTIEFMRIAKHFRIKEVYSQRKIHTLHCHSKDIVIYRLNVKNKEIKKVKEKDAPNSLSSNLSLTFDTGLVYSEAPSISIFLTVSPNTSLKDDPYVIDINILIFEIMIRSFIYKAEKNIKVAEFFSEQLVTWKYGFKYMLEQEYDEELDDLVPPTADLVEKDLEDADWLTKEQRVEVEELIKENRKLKNLMRKKKYETKNLL